jgi:hypothetical protein
MSKIYKIYLDVCCLNRTLDDLEQSRIRLEAEAVISNRKKIQQMEDPPKFPLKRGILRRFSPLFKGGWGIDYAICHLPSAFSLKRI